MSAREQAEANLDDFAGDELPDRAVLALKVFAVLAIDLGDLAEHAEETLGRERIVQMLKDTEGLKGERDTDVFEYVNAVLDEHEG